MSRTYRAAKMPIECDCDAPIGFTWRRTLPTKEETERESNKARRQGRVPYKSCGCNHSRKHDYNSKRNHKRDNKPSHKSSRSDKKVYGRSRKAKIKDAMRRNDYENIPTFKRTNDWIRMWDYY